MQPPIINQFRGQYDFLSNFYDSPIERLNGRSFPTAEHAYQAYKTLDEEQRDWIAGLRTPGEAKRAGRQIDLRPDWETRKVAVMHSVVSIKFRQYPELLDRLIDTGGSLLVEGNTWHDQYWGDCTCAKHVYTPGINALGTTLMWVRLKLSAERNQ